MQAGKRFDSAGNLDSALLAFESAVRVAPQDPDVTAHDTNIVDF